MPATIPVLTTIAFIITLASVIQSAVGFAFAMFATPLLLWLGLPLQQVITIIAVSSFISSLIGANHLRNAIPWRPALTATLIRVVALMAGLLILQELVNLDQSNVRAIVGAVLLLLVGLKIGVRAEPAEKVHWLWSGLAFSSSGLLVGICGMGGPPLVLWLLAHDWPADRSRGFLFVSFASTIPVQLLLLYLLFGQEILLTLLWSLLLAPVILLGTIVGLRLGSRLPRERLRLLMHIILLIIGLSAVLPVLIRSLQ